MDVMAIRRMIMAMGGGDKMKIKQGKFTGNGTLKISIPCEFAPDIIVVWCDSNISANPGDKALTWAVVQKDKYATFMRYTNGANVNPTSFTTNKITGYGADANTSSYSNGTMLLWFDNQSQNVFTSSAEYDYLFLKYSE